MTQEEIDLLKKQLAEHQAANAKLMAAVSAQGATAPAVTAPAPGAPDMAAIQAHAFKSAQAAIQSEAAKTVHGPEAVAEALKLMEGWQSQGGALAQLGTFNDAMSFVVGRKALATGAAGTAHAQKQEFNQGAGSVMSGGGAVPPPPARPGELKPPDFTGKTDRQAMTAMREYLEQKLEGKVW